MYSDELLKEARAYWDEKAKIAKEYMQSVSKDKNIKVLIEIAAQHPLDEGMYPNKEFKARLNEGIRLYNLEKENGNEVEIYVPGSRHRIGENNDKISLANAGKNYLIDNGVVAECIHAEDLNKKYKGADGVYNSADECFVASSYFKDKKFNKLISVISPVQVMRKTLLYIEFGVMPLNYSVPLDNTYHNYISEAFFQVPYVLFEDHSWQGKDSRLGNKTREERVPNDN